MHPPTPPIAAMCCCCRPGTMSSAAPSPSRRASLPLSCCRRGRSAASLRRGCRCCPLAAAHGRPPAFSPSLLLVALVAAGFLGSRDPLSNPLPLTLWTLLWVGLTLAQGMLGNLWAWINPWYGPYWIARSLGLPSPLLQLPRADRLLAGVHSVCRLCMVRTDRSGARRSGAACHDRGRLCGGQSRRDADLRLPRLEPARRVPVGVLRHDLRLRHLAKARATTTPRSASACPVPASPMPARCR